MARKDISSVPEDYKTREQSWIKHLALEAYVQSWVQKLASVSRRTGAIRLWYVDVFAGPWETKSDSLEDTSIHIGLNALVQARRFWNERGCNVEVGAIFVEKKPESFDRLQKYLKEQNHTFIVKTFNGDFGEHADEIAKILGDDPAFCFVDPTGWTGADMGYIRKIANARNRDVMINFMFNYVNRFCSLAEQADNMKKFFGATVPEFSSKEQMLSFYRNKLKEICGFEFAAELSVRDPSKERTKFHLVIGGNHPAVLEVFRSVEKKVIHDLEPKIRAMVKEEINFEKTAQLSLLTPSEIYSTDEETERYVRDGQSSVLRVFPRLFQEFDQRVLSYYYPRILEECHVTLSELERLTLEFVVSGQIEVDRFNGKLSDKSLVLKVPDKLSLLTREKSKITEPAQGSLFDL